MNLILIVSWGELMLYFYSRILPKHSLLCILGMELDIMHRDIDILVKVFTSVPTLLCWLMPKLIMCMMTSLELYKAVSYRKIVKQKK